MNVSLCSVEYGDFCLYLELDSKIDKSELPSAQIRTIAYETIERRYLSNFWTHVYTDGSMMERGIGVGNHFAFYKAVGRDTTYFDG
ncbi:uncharacterized protein TNCT_631331 [Trichonephila clavata]|uniref:Uncharacterized protein n=1 Tax=Trichonephila clavata TaxID=2740835 RepID=A0A8X6IN16_TRICU|nr:uncharacterized protein TNCT_631331 [Trichonephila clavata]